MHDPAKLTAYLADYQYSEGDNPRFCRRKNGAGVLTISGKIPVFTNEFWTSGRAGRLDS